MLGNLISNQNLTELVESRVIEFRPFYDENKAQIAQYPLKIRKLLKKFGKSFVLVHDFTKADDYIIKPNEYVIVEVFEQIILPKGIVGRFIPASNLIELGIGLTAGKLEFPFGQENEKIRFGLKNLTESEIIFNKEFRIAYIEFFDLRYLKTSDTVLLDRDILIYAQRRNSIFHDGEINYDADVD
ncbi:dCTP deaminase domain-containing protein [Mucilaginibacter sp. X4EP1]|uniref:dCTP deaminase domain-containing protein n=1 Tax=Mucilaginibacter sp. X4EP1 TaxID=2723092 RepID=UPI002168C0D5|nr:hypothetical protein [Mucilaginibacter sp. X4EP1]MCS3811611.1 deoxycytidine triphosphate deaminase [Mucilaginibacter sp. X4EP1]